MKNKFVLILVLAMVSASYAGLYDEAVLRVNFGQDSVNDVSRPSSKGVATDLSFVDISSPLMKNSNGRGAVFNGKTSGIDYQLGAKNELRIEGAITYHIRVRFNSIAGQQFLMGRYQSENEFVTALQTESTSAWGYFGIKKKTGFEKIGHRAKDCLKTGIFYDIFFCFKPYTTGRYGAVRTYVYNAQTGRQLAASRNWGTSIRRMYHNNAINFRIGNAGNGLSLSGLKGTVGQVNVWKKVLTEKQMQSLSKQDPKNSFPTGVYRPTLLAKARKSYVFYDDFETRDNVGFWTSYGKPYKVNFKGLTEEHAFSGKKSFKLDVTFPEQGRYIWCLYPKPAPEAAGKSLSGYMLIGKKSNVSVALGVSFSFPPTRSSGFTGPGQAFTTTGGRWVKINVGNTLETDFQRFGDSMGDLMLHSYTGYVHRDDIVPVIGRIRIDVNAKAGGRLVVYIDDVGLHNNSGKMVKMPARHPSSAPVRKRCNGKISQLEKKLANAKKKMARLGWTRQTSDFKRALDAGFTDAQKSLSSLKQHIPFSIFALARAENKVAEVADTANNLRAWKRLQNVSYIIYIAENLTSRNYWIRPFDVLIPGKIGKRLSLTACRGEYEPASFILRAKKNLHEVTLKAGDLINTDQHTKIPPSNIDIKLVKCWYQGASAGSAVKQMKLPKKLIPELLVNDDSLVKVDYKKKENYLKLTFPDKIKYRWISSLKPTKKSILNADCPVKDSKTLLPVNLPAGKNQQFWITVKIPDDIPAGHYTGPIRLIVNGKAVDHLTLTVTVLPFDLSKPYYIPSIDYHGSLTDKPGIASFPKSKTQMLAELKNMVAHGFTNCQHYFAVNDNSLREVLKLRTQAGMDNKTLYLKGHGLYLLHWSPKELEKIKARVRHIIKIAKEYGTKDVYFYGRDEATGKGLLAQRKSWQAVHQAGGKIFVAGGRDDLALVGDILDMEVKAGWPDRKFVEGWHKLGHQIFSYANPQTGIENPEIYRRNYGLVMWKYNYDGIADNAYQHTYGFIWNDFDNNLYRSHSMTYPTVDGVVDTIEWEGFREGIDDVRYITTLEAMVRKSTADTSAAKKFLTKLKNSNTIETANLDNLRKEIIKYIIKLSN